MPVIRRSAGEDAASIAALLERSWRETYSPLIGETRVEDAVAVWHRPGLFLSELDDPHVASFVATETDGSIVGHAMAELRPGGEVWLERLHVDPEHFGTGLSADLLHAAIAAFVGEGAVIALEVLEGNDRAIAFYRKQGFDVVEKHACGGVDDVPTLVMKRAIARA